MSKWIGVCQLNDINPKTGVCALVNGKQVAIFRPRDNDELFAIDNMDPFAKSNVLSRGLICEHDEQLWVASPLKKQRFNLSTGQCLENDVVSLATYKIRVNKDAVEISD
ncbi:MULTISPECIES: nitrite reductase small subunit NirD [unclassified Moritella]|uniref:nitrite reductase small subunit NirD n=1 Tax=unclassified Moritella TaxID=2637987 RepID=UPI001BAAB393|nr:MULTISPECIES: nitrite reductase small subunit NirD [unclassified Moritella]QUM84882.1 nitrite reductase small subunit NirD [Moritella sp. 28]QUM89125.1 nitrite reductase small subunit NirD [Moritella sp. 36]